MFVYDVWPKVQNPEGPHIQKSNNTNQTKLDPDNPFKSINTNPNIQQNQNFTSNVNAVSQSQQFQSGINQHGQMRRNNN